MAEDDKINSNKFINEIARIEFETDQDVTKFYYEVLIKNSSLETGRFSYHKEKWVWNYPDFDTFWKVRTAAHDGYPECYLANFNYVCKVKPKFLLEPPAVESELHDSTKASTGP